ncbi:MAG: hypothetical protein KAX38_07005 [Candidatus Krumholzibacteria bacterium]|nr:hypothetical protein [Candidatus Krumholzibacteria bacterium]
MKRFMYFSVMALSLAVSVLFHGIAIPQSISVFYDCNELPGPWNITGNGNVLGSAEYHHLLDVNDGILTMSDPDTRQWIWLEYINPSIGLATDFYIEVRVKVVSNNDEIASPTITLGNFNSARPFDNRLNFLYTLDLYPERLEFFRVDNETIYDATLLGTHSIPDFSTTFHEIIMHMQQNSGRNITVYVDGMPVIVITGETTEQPLNCVAVAHGRAVGVGISEWDYINFETTAPVSTEQSTWGDIKDQFKK